MRLLTYGLAFTVTMTAAVAAQDPPAKPGPEHKRLEFFVGQWNFQGEAKPSPLGPGGKITGTDTCEWFTGGFAVVCRGKGTGPKGPSSGMNVMSYDPGRKAYTFFAVSSMGDNIFVRGNVAGKVWTWEDEAPVQGKPMTFRATLTEQSPTSYSFKLEAGPADGQLMVIEEGTATKQK